uniref:Uncharacterized protein n=1 Tax=Anguilla anguilla TaxID=7936 RepID=A0A0E9TIX7_ANGAN
MFLDLGQLQLPGDHGTTRAMQPAPYGGRDGEYQ